MDKGLSDSSANGEGGSRGGLFPPPEKKEQVASLRKVAPLQGTGLTAWHRSYSSAEGLRAEKAQFLGDSPRHGRGSVLPRPSTLGGTHLEQEG